jgi:hypothetical protein
MRKHGGFPRSRPVSVSIDLAENRSLGEDEGQCLRWRVALFFAAGLVVFQDLVDGSDPGVQLGPAHRLLAPVTGRHCVPQHLPHRLASQPELLGRLALAHLVDDNRSPNPRIQLHCVHLSGVPQNTTLWECSLEPVFDGLVLLRR